jgi:hypothetical protein
MDVIMYPTYYFKINGYDPLISRRKERHAADNNQLKLVPPIKQLESTHHPIRVPTYGLGQLILIPKKIHVQQTLVVYLLVNLLVATKLLVYGDGMPLHQQKKVNSHP